MRQFRTIRPTDPKSAWQFRTVRSAERSREQAYPMTPPPQVALGPALPKTPMPRPMSAPDLSQMVTARLPIVETDPARRRTVNTDAGWPSVDRSAVGDYRNEAIISETTLSLRAMQAAVPLTLLDALLGLLPLVALVLWGISLQRISLGDMNDLGLISALSLRIIASLGLLVLGFAICLRRKALRVPLLAFYLLALIVVLYGTPILIEQMPHFTPIYRHAGYTDYIMQHGGVDPNLDIYFDWPGFFVLAALFTKLAGYSTILSYAGWAAIFNNVLYFGPMYLLFTSFTRNQRLVWLSLLIFYLTNWVGQDYFSPQGFNFFLYLVIVAILVCWFRRASPLGQGRGKSWLRRWLQEPGPLRPPLSAWQRRGMLVVLIGAYGLIVCSHPLTPFFVLLAVGLLLLFRRIQPFWLLPLFIAMTCAWIFGMARPYLADHVSQVVGTLGDLGSNVPKSVTQGKLVESPLYQVVAKTRLYMTLLLWLLGGLGALKRLWQGHRDLSLLLLALAAFPLIAAQSYGGEMLLRIYLFSQPAMVFLAASLFSETSLKAGGIMGNLRRRFNGGSFKPLTWGRNLAIVILCLFLLSTFFLTRYGDEHVDFISYDEWNAVQYLYNVAPVNSIVVEAWNDPPLFYKDYGKYDVKVLNYVDPGAVAIPATDEVVRLFDSFGGPSYIIFSQEEQIHASAWNGLSPDGLERLRVSLLKTGKFKLIYGNADAQILQFTG